MPPTQPETPNEPGQPSQPDPLPQVTPDVPQPLPEPTPTPDPLPETPQPSETPTEPAPEPDIVLPPAPDIPQPIPETQPIPPIEPTQNNASSLHQSIEQDKSIDGEAANLLQASLVITSPYSERPQEVALELQETTLGRAGSSDILLDQDTLTSRHHALLKRDGDRYFIYDQRSANGVMVNGEKIPSETAHELRDGDYITIGEYELVFHLGPSTQSTQSGQEMYQTL
jgi:pSer/pThr/pTyr-binding forkhead associated (FHA) protein